MPIQALEASCTASDLVINYAVGPDRLRAALRKYSTGTKRTAMLVSHGGQRQNRWTTHGQQVRAFAFLVPFGNRLLRSSTGNDTWPDQAAELFTEAQFATVGIPSLYLLPHTFDNLNKDYDGKGTVYLTAVKHWDVLVFEDTDPWPREPNPTIPLYRLLNGQPCLADLYSSFIMHTCRSEQEFAGGKCVHISAAAPSGLYSYDDRTTVRF